MLNEAIPFSSSEEPAFDGAKSQQHGMASPSGGPWDERQLSVPTTSIDLQAICL
jgi:hypothetical protein